MEKNSLSMEWRRGKDKGKKHDDREPQKSESTRALSYQKHKHKFMKYLDFVMLTEEGAIKVGISGKKPHHVTNEHQ